MEPRVNFHWKYTNVSCTILFLLFFLLHLGIGAICATDSAFHLLPLCHETNCTYTRNGCPNEQIQLIGPDQVVLQPCSNPCDDGYIPWVGPVCLQKSSIENYENEARCDPASRRLTEEDPHEADLIIQLYVRVLTVTIGWGFLLQTFPRAMVWATIGLHLLGLAVNAIAENVPAIVVFIAVVLIPITMVLVLSTWRLSARR